MAGNFINNTLITKTWGNPLWGSPYDPRMLDSSEKAKGSQDKTWQCQAIDYISTGFKTYRLFMDILGYVPVASVYTGSGRMVAGAVLWIAAHTSKTKKPKNQNEWKQLGIQEIIRGFLESMIPFGKALNALADIYVYTKTNDGTKPLPEKL